MNFLKKVGRSVYGPAYYEELKGKSVGYSLGYFFALIAWLSIITAVVFLFRLIPTVNTVLINAGTGVVNGYPDNLAITVASGSVSTNVPEPYFMPLAPALATDVAKAYGDASTPPSNLLVIDTKDPLTISEFQNDNTLLLLSSDSVAYSKDPTEQSVVIEPLDPRMSFVVNKTGVASFITTAESYLKYLDGAIVIFMPIGIFMGLALRLIYLFLLALLVWVIARVSKMDIGYGQAYRWGIHLMTLPLFITIALWLISPGISVPFLFTLLTLVMAAVNLRGSAPAKVPATPTV